MQNAVNREFDDPLLVLLLIFGYIFSVECLLDRRTGVIACARLAFDDDKEIGVLLSTDDELGRALPTPPTCWRISEDA